VNIDAIEEDLALLGLVEATEQTDDAAFPAPVGPTNANRSPWRRMNETSCST
jgi:hypothetical protein